MLTDRDKCDIFSFIAEVTHDVETGQYTRVDLAGRIIARVIRFLMEHPDMCAAEFDDFLQDKEYALQEFDRLVEK